MELNEILLSFSASDILDLTITHVVLHEVLHAKKKLVLNNRRYVHKTVSTTLKFVSEIFQNKYKV